MGDTVHFDVENLNHRRAVHRWERTSVGDLLERVTYSFPDKPALVAAGGAFAYPEHERLSYREADRQINRIANALLGRGLRRSDRVMLVCDNSIESYLVKLACAKAGLVATPVNPMMAPDVVAHLIDRCSPAMAIVDAELAPQAEAAFASTELTVDVTIPIGGETISGSVELAELIDGAPDSEPDVQVHGDDIWEILFTSGTTSMPKAVMLSHTYTYMAAYAHLVTMTRGLHVESDAVFTNFLPMTYHIAGHILPVPAFLCGGTFVMGRRYDPEATAEAITRERVTGMFAGSPVMVDGLADALEGDPERYDASSLGVVMYGWAQISPQTVARYKRLCGDEVSLVEIFGQTESISNHRFWVDKWSDAHTDGAPRDNYVGVPCPLLASILVDPATGGTQEVEPGVPGEALYRSPAMTAGYFRDEDGTREAFKDGWFHSGDSCVYDDAGLRIMVDRYKDIVKTGGENVSSLRVESVVNQHPAVQKSAVVGLPHERWGDAVTVFAIAAPGLQATEEEVAEFCRDRLAGFERPKRIVFVQELPETVGGKVLKYKLREQHADLYATPTEAR